MDIWNEWRFEPWNNGTANGLYRRVSMVKSGFLGEVARYYADDYILWKYLPQDPERVFKTARSETDLLVQRYIFLQTDGISSTKKKSFLFGFRGFVEIHIYTLGDMPSKEIKDIAFLSNAARKATEGI